MRFVDPKNDIAFKKIFGDEKHTEILISFLNALLGFKEKEKIKKVKLLNPYQAPKIEELKETILDIQATNEKDETFIVEMQRKDLNNFEKRSLYYTSKAYIQQLDKGKDYSKLKKVYFIGIVNFKMFEGESCITKHLIVNQETQNQDLDMFEFVFVELPKFKIKRDEIEKLESIEDKWIWFLKHTQKLEVVPEKLEKIEEFKEAFLIASQYKWSKKDIEVYDYIALKEYDDINALKTSFGKGKIEGIEEGKKLQQREIAKNLLEIGVEKETIAVSTGLSVDEIKLLMINR